MFESLAIGALAAVHLFAGRLRLVEVIPRSRWLSAAGGASVAYVFVHILPELEEAQHAWPEEALVRHQAYLVALVGLATFYGLERLARSGGARASGGFWVHIGSFALYSLLIGYLLVHRSGDGTGFAFFLAMALHLFANDHGLRHHHRERYERVGRWLLAAAVGAGALLGAAADLPQRVLHLLFAFLAGAIVLNVLKEELPEERESHFPAFALGVLGCAALLLAA